jgi:PAS domain S-box-containing protein
LHPHGDSHSHDSRTRIFAPLLFAVGLATVVSLWVTEFAIRATNSRAIEYQIELNERSLALGQLRLGLEQLLRPASQAEGRERIAQSLRSLDLSQRSPQALDLSPSLRADLAAIERRAMQRPLTNAPALSRVAIEAIGAEIEELRMLHGQQRAQALAAAQQRSTLVFWIGTAAAILATSLLVATALVTRGELRRRRRSEQAAQRASANTQRFLEAIPVAVHMRAATGEHWLWNAAAESLFGRSRQAVLGSRASLVTGEFVPAAQAMRERALRGEITEMQDMRARRADGTVFDVRTMAAPYVSASGEIVGAIFASYDITAEVRREAERREREARQRDTVVFEVHHRIKNHLQGLAGLIQQRVLPDQGKADEIASQVLSLAAVHGIQAKPGKGLTLRASLEAITNNVAAVTGTTCVLQFSQEVGNWRLAEPHAVGVALALNELITNATKHRSRQTLEPVEIRLTEEASHSTITVRNRGRLPAGFDLSAQVQGDKGLSLVAGLLPGHGATLAIAQSGAWVVVELTLATSLLLPANASDTASFGVAA